MFKIQVLNAISPVGLSQFSAEHFEVAPTMLQPAGILVRSQDMHAMTLPESVKVVGRAGAGVNNIPVAALTKRGILVLNTPGANANAVRELVIAGMLLCSRHICQAWQYVKNLSETDDAAMSAVIELHKKQFAGYELMGKTLGVVGLGSVGVKVANAAMHLGMRVIGYDPAISVNRAWELSSAVEQAHQLEGLLAKADFVSLHVPLVADTEHMMNHLRLQSMKKGAVLLNFSRDGIVDNQALLIALNEGKVYAYVSDFPCALLKNHPRVICLPHLGASTREAEENCAVMIVKQVCDYLQRGAISHSVNFPNVDVPQNDGVARVAIVNENVPNMVAQMSHVLGQAGRNIVSLVNKSRGDIAYTLIDLDAAIDERGLKQLTAIQGVLQARQWLK
ncbi:MAG: 3-phosphoglycerate dehydrogenase [Gammaproteobacteria bacterium RIFCSPHIGHO2_12_FULL_45_12]|nr:MAG: 3-phosphoglycerate dehydrogenase [Gammaproteobacteria bacterium RIFCSPHIGHO2_12_FULL_45_12]